MSNKPFAVKADTALLPKRMPDIYCNARKSQDTGTGWYCHRPAGWGTTHPGVGRCKLHGGNSPKYEGTAMIKAYRSTALASPKDLQERAKDFLLDPDITDLSREIAGLRALEEAIHIQVVEGKTTDFEAGKMLTDIADSIGRLSTRHEEIIRGKRYVVAVSKVQRWANGIKEVLERNIEDPVLLGRIAQEISVLSKADEDYPRSD